MFSVELDDTAAQSLQTSLTGDIDGIGALFEYSLPVSHEKPEPDQAVGTKALV